MTANGLNLTATLQKVLAVRVNLLLRHRVPRLNNRVLKLLGVGRVEVRDGSIQVRPHGLDHVEVGAVSRTVLDDVNVVLRQVLLDVLLDVRTRTVLKEDALAVLNVLPDLRKALANVGLSSQTEGLFRTLVAEEDELRLVADANSSPHLEASNVLHALAQSRARPFAVRDNPLSPAGRIVARSPMFVRKHDLPQLLLAEANHASNKLQASLNHLRLACRNSLANARNKANSVQVPEDGGS